MITPNTPAAPPSGRPKLALIAGPTASGKSDLAVELALAIQRAGGKAVVVNADSAQVYADLQVLSARPTLTDMRGVPHRLFGEWDGVRPCSAADWAQAARVAIAAAHHEGRVPILVGGTGLYLRTLLDGIAPVPPIDPVVRDQVRSLPLAEARAALELEDPRRAAQLNPNDATRTTRALEVIRSTRLSLLDWHAHRGGGIGSLVDLVPAVLLPDRKWLYRRCDARFSTMLECGAVEEVGVLLARKLDPDLPVMRAIGVQQLAALVRGETDRAAALAEGQQATRNYAKRQYTWFRHQAPVYWPRYDNNDCALSALKDRLFQK